MGGHSRSEGLSRPHGGLSIQDAPIQEDGFAAVLLFHISHRMFSLRAGNGIANKCVCQHRSGYGTMPPVYDGGIRLRKLTVYPWHTGKLTRPMRLLVVSDLHNSAYADILPLLEGTDALLLPGDIANRYQQRFERGLDFLRIASARVPTYLGIGNHEMRLKRFSEFRSAVEQLPVKFLFNRYERLGALVIGCWYRPARYGHTDILPQMEAENGVRILMSHRPEDYHKYLQDAKVDLVLSGHAHGGQIRVCGQGLYAPGQGILPKLTHGIVDGKMIISAGAGNTVPVPRWGNPREVLRIDLD